MTMVSLARIVSATLVLSGAGAAPVLALNAYWHGVISSSWNQGVSGSSSNWYSLPPPNGTALPVPDNTATFKVGAKTYSVKLMAITTRIKTMAFPAGTPTYTINLLGKNLIVEGLGVVNSSLTPPIFIAQAKAKLTFDNESSAGNATYQLFGVTNSRGELNFMRESRAGKAKIQVNRNGHLGFYEDSTADHAAIDNRTGGLVEFHGNTTGGSAAIKNQTGGRVDFSLSTGPKSDHKLTVSSINNAGIVDVGLNQMTVLKDFSMTAGRLDMEVDQKPGFLNVRQNVDLDGELRLSNFDFNYGSVKRFVLIRAGATLTGKFSKVTFAGLPVNYKAAVSYVGKEVILTLTHK